MLMEFWPLAFGVVMIAVGLSLLGYTRRRYWEAEARMADVLEKARANKAFEEQFRAMEAANAQLQARTEELTAAGEAVQGDLQRRQLLLELSQSVLSTLELKALLPALLKKLRELITYHAAGVFLYNQDKTELQLAAAEGLYQVEMGEQLSGHIGIPAIVATTEKPMLVTDAETDPRFAPLVASARVHSALYHPIVLNKQVYGVICLWHMEANSYTQRDLQLLASITSEAARAIRNAEIYQELDARLNFIVTLWEASKNLTSSVESDSGAWKNLLAEVVSSTAYLFGAEKAVLFRYDKGRRDLTYDLARGIDEARLPALLAAINASPLGLPFFLRAPFQVKELPKDPRLADMQPFAASEGVRSLLWAPLSGRQRTVGAIALFTTAPRTWTQMELQWLDIFTNMLSTTLENTYLFQDLASEKTQLQVLIDNVPEGVFTTDASGRLLTWNAAAHRITGWTLAEVLGKPCSEFIRCQTVDEVWCKDRCPLKSAMEGETKFESGVQNLAVLRKDGGKVPVFITSGPIHEEEGRVVGSILVFRDITKEKEIEQMKEDFLATITHDLKSPLASVMGYTELLLNPKLGGVNQSQQEFIEAILRSSKTLQFLIDNILEITRMEAGKMVFNPGLFNLGALLGEIHEMFVPLAAPKSLQLETHCEDGVIARGDRDKLKEVFINLYANAIKFTRPRGRITTTVELHDDRVVVSVADTGKGIPPDQISRLFEKFAQVKSDEKRGTGLGLYIVRRIMDAHGEEIAVESEVGAGTTFRFGLPRIKNDHGSNGHRSVLILERDEETSDTVQRTLEEEGISTMLANSAREALRAVRERKPQLVVIDSQLPELTSDNLLEELKGTSAVDGHELRVLMLCDWREASPPEADMLIYRPLDENELLRKVRSLIQPLDV